MIRALIFDCFGVLYWDNINRLYNLVHPSQFQELSDIISAFDHGYIDKEDFLDQISELAQISVEAVSAVAREKYSRNEPLIQRTAELKKSYKIALLSNMGRDTINDIFDEAERTRLFDQVVISSDEGLVKPSSDLYELTLERLGVAPDEVIFIDDRPSNIDGAERLGMYTILFTTNNQFDVELHRILATTNQA